MLVEADIAPNVAYRLTVADFELLAESGAFGDNERVELIEGDIIVMAPLHMPHATAHAELIVRVGIALREHQPELQVAITPSVVMSEHSMPMPDIAIAPRRLGQTGPAQREDALLLIEVSHSSAKFDLEVKAALYARGGVPEYWVIDFAKGELTQFRTPEPAGYREQRCQPLGEPLTALTIPNLTIDTAGLI